MAFSHGTNGRIWMDGFAASVNLEDINANGKTDVAETTVFSNTAKTYIPGLDMGQLKMKGFFFTNSLSATTTFEYFLNARRRAIFPLMFAPEGGQQIGDPAFLMNGQMTDFQVDTMVKDAASLKLEFMSSTGLGNGKIVTVDGTRIATDADGEGRIDNGLSSLNGLKAILSVSSVLGTLPLLDVKLQHSADDSVWTDISGGAFVQQSVSTGVNAEYISVTGTIQRYVRAVWTVAGTLPSFTFNVAVRRL